MRTESAIDIAAPARRIFDAAADLARWPAILPHYRFIEYFERGRDEHVVKMAAHRDGLPVSWVSRQTIDREAMQIRFRHLRAFTKGMHVVWTLEDSGGSTRVTITHELAFRIPLFAPLAEAIIGRFFIENIAAKTLAALKRHVEPRQ